MDEVSGGRVRSTETDVRLYGWFEGDLVEQIDNGGACATVHER